MKIVSNHDSSQTTQRVVVGLTGLGIVLVLIGLASAIFSLANPGVPVVVVDQETNVVTNMVVPPAVAVPEKGKEDPLAEMGVTPRAAPSESAEAVVQRQAAQQAQQQQ